MCDPGLGQNDEVQVVRGYFKGQQMVKVVEVYKKRNASSTLNESSGRKQMAQLSMGAFTPERC